jgi:hypothetical protein
MSNGTNSFESTTTEEYLSMPPTNILDQFGKDRLAQVKAEIEAQRQVQYAEIRFNDRDTKILIFDPSKTVWKEDTIRMEAQPEKKIWRLHFAASEYIQPENKWTRFKTVKLAPTWGNTIIANNEAGNLTLQITQKDTGLGTDYDIIAKNNL